MKILFIIFWLIISSRVILFYIYLWQLKEYQVKRFIDHFRTEKGKNLFVNQVFFLKIFLLAGLLFFSNNQSIPSQKFFAPLVLWITFAFFFLLTLHAFLRIGQGKIKHPVFTKKTIVLSAAGALAEVILLLFILQIENLYNFAILLLLSNVLMPLVATLVVLAFQPFAVFFKRRFLKKAIAKRGKYPDLKVVGITGSYGKTSTKEILSIILAGKFNVLKTKEHQNSEVGISRCILEELNDDHQVFVAEMGTYGQGGIKLLADMVQPQIGMLAGINEQHLSLFGSIDKTTKAKYELIESLPQEGLAVFNGDNERCRKLYEMTKLPKKIYTILKNEVSDIWAEEITVERNFLYFTVCTKEGEKADFRVNLLGKHNIPNILGSVLVAKHLGMSLEETAKEAKNIRESQGALQFLNGTRGLNVLDASYSANPHGVIGDLEYLNNLSGKKIIIMPCLIELGKRSKEIHKEIGKKIAETCDLAIITTKERFSDVQEGAQEQGMGKDKVLFIGNVEEILRRLEIFAVPGDIILLEGRVPASLKEGLTKTEHNA